MYSYNKAVHISVSDIYHHHAMFETLIMSTYASAFLRGARLGFAAPAATVAFFLEATRFSLALIFTRLRLTPNEPIVRLPFLLFLSPLPMGF